MTGTLAHTQSRGILVWAPQPGECFLRKVTYHRAGTAGSVYASNVHRPHTYVAFQPFLNSNPNLEILEVHKLLFKKFK